MTPKCPSCGEAKSVRRSHRHPLDKLLGFIHVYPFRCDRCDYRFYRFSKAQKRHQT
jgi:C4-type Zn-finger protein